MSVDTFTKLSQTVHRQFQKTFADASFPKRLETAFEICREFYSDMQPDSNACNCYYHDEHHVAEVTECLSKLLTQYKLHAPKSAVPLTLNMLEFAIVAALFHDAGYICKKELITHPLSLDHETRSAEIVTTLLPKDQWTQSELHTIQNIILGTHPTFFHEILTRETNNPELHFLIKALRTADYIGQIGQPNYIDRLPLLFQELQEVCLTSKSDSTKQPSPYIHLFKSLNDFLQQTPAFWNHVLHQILQQDCSNLYLLLSDPFPTGPNTYLQTAQHNIDRLQSNQSSHQ